MANEDVTGGGTRRRSAAARASPRHERYRYSKLRTVCEPWTAGMDVERARARAFRRWALGALHLNQPDDLVSRCMGIAYRIGIRLLKNDFHAEKAVSTITLDELGPIILQQDGRLHSVESPLGTY